MSQAVRERVWSVLSDWFLGASDEAIVMTWPDARSPGGQAFVTLGVPRHEFNEIDDFPVLCRPLTQETERMLESLERASAPRDAR
jgi:CRISPR-associated protein Cas2